MASRNDRQMMELILHVARSNARIRAVIQDGSRSNPSVSGDIFQDFDIIYIVKSVRPFTRDHRWVDVFGERMIMQMPEDMELYPPDESMKGGFSYLLQFLDGNRIDLTLVPVKHSKRFTEDSLCKLLLDKDGLFDGSPLPPASDRDYLVEAPTARSFADCCNEFWYTNSGLAKGLWRKEMILVKELYHRVIHEALVQMTEWYIESRHGAVNAGKFGKYFERYLEPEIYAQFLATYVSADWESNWRCVYATIDLFRKMALEVAEKHGYEYRMDEDLNVSAFLRHVEQLPAGATTIY
ncbi:aminoglycoside 6-adenylyltransferase [Dyadobacter jiangsuensis]|uniref:Aminoglycoside 6-adenylyltransferase n=1 Tax=Dyadobacter jiangsuensis TaxID=1591085 RepID=A0A2P8GI87_9BACT|nr:aminoglycoside 6-adenylyltransferase [Dyadobacter jiangsuensis]PSL33675.1 aminoglycoside 6-adenylyltransferase [Dyadobacter jiangsuensis]